MEDEEQLEAKAKRFESRIISSSKNNENILILAHHDADGIAGASMLTELIVKNRGHAQTRGISSPSLALLDRVASASKFDLIIFLDICAGLSDQVSKGFGDKWLIIDHHEIPKREMEHDQILNPYQFGIDGGTSISASGLCYLISKSSVERSSFLALVGALGDRQDVGPRRGFVGINAKIIESSPGIDTTFDLLLWSRETKPVHESIANTFSIFIPGLTGNKDACLASLRGAGFELRVGSRWKTLSEFGDEEKQRLLEAIVPHLSGTTYTVEDLVGSVYLLNSRDEYSLVRDARDFAMLLSACGRVGKSGIAVSLCLGEEEDLAFESEQAMTVYRSEILKSVQALLSSEDRIVERGSYALILGDGIVGERLAGSVCQIIASYSRFKNRIVLLRTTTADGDVKVSGRPGKERADCDLGAVFSNIAEETKGTGGGLRGAAGMRFSISRQQDFQQTVDSLFQDQRKIVR